MWKRLDYQARVIVHRIVHSSQQPRFHATWKYNNNTRHSMPADKVSAVNDNDNDNDIFTALSKADTVNLIYVTVP